MTVPSDTNATPAVQAMIDYAQRNYGDTRRERRRVVTYVYRDVHEITSDRERVGMLLVFADAGEVARLVVDSWRVPVTFAGDSMMSGTYGGHWEWTYTLTYGDGLGHVKTVERLASYGYRLFTEEGIEMTETPFTAVDVTAEFAERIRDAPKPSIISTKLPAEARLQLHSAHKVYERVGVAVYIVCGVDAAGSSTHWVVRHSWGFTLSCGAYRERAGDLRVADVIAKDNHSCTIKTPEGKLLIHGRDIDVVTLLPLNAPPRPPQRGGFIAKGERRAKPVDSKPASIY